MLVKILTNVLNLKSIYVKFVAEYSSFSPAVRIPLQSSLLQHLLKNLGVGQVRDEM